MSVMACSIDFIEELCEILSPLGEVRSRKMMGDYVIYVNEKCVITACDNLAYVKKIAMYRGFDGGCRNRDTLFGS